MTPTAPSRGLALVLEILSALLILSLVVLGGLLYLASWEAASEFPEAAHLRWPVLLMSWAVVACYIVFCTVIWRLASLVRRSKIFEPRALAWVRGMSLAMAVASVILVVIFVIIPGSPATYAIGMALLMSVALGVLVEVMRGLLALAVGFRAELDEVI